ncbi:N-acetylmuramic acid 6-phosphate etherase [Raoultella sp. WB_B2P2-3]|uniref:N-acetylmuramic acid 6-phosphate etherase n=1 Tax=Raoultella scottii TaxID=3040937 RepID=A0ABU8Z420_9ENTR|nr:MULTISPECIES: N-acetylmuramic acid 6-phosphate etherase [Enterobacteriaceae]MVT05056.1 N-acetylmuramic acid 6-phosphate etherase [Raoultella sp. 10-1]PAC09255.1 N-acetylmuramic acid 6-phosphate etherase [Enterobacter sp. 10-1]
MSSKPTASMTERRHPDTRRIDSLTTYDMLTMLHADGRQIANAIDACLPEMTRLVDNAAATLSRGGRLVIVGAGASGRAALQAVNEFAPEEKHSLVGLIAGGPAAALQEMETAANDYDLGACELQALRFSNNDMLLALTVSGKTPWVWGAMRHAWSLGAPVAVLTQQADSEAAQLADIIVAPQTGPEAVAGFGNPKAQLAQRQLLSMLTTGLAIRGGRVFSNLRVDLQATSPRWAERQIAIVMEAAGCSRSEAKAALAGCNQHCRTAILMLLSGLDAWRARELLMENNDHLRIALQDKTHQLAGSQS